MSRYVRRPAMRVSRSTPYNLSGCPGNVGGRDIPTTARAFAFTPRIHSLSHRTGLTIHCIEPPATGLYRTSAPPVRAPLPSCQHAYLRCQPQISQPVLAYSRLHDSKVRDPVSTSQHERRMLWYGNRPIVNPRRTRQSAVSLSGFYS